MKISFKNKGKIKYFFDKQRLREFINSRTVPKGMLKDVLQTKLNDTRWKSVSTQSNDENRKHPVHNVHLISLIMTDFG